MKSLAQLCLAMAEAGIRLQTGEDLSTSGTRHHAIVIEGPQVMQYIRPATVPALHGQEQDPAAAAE